MEAVRFFFLLISSFELNANYILFYDSYTGNVSDSITMNSEVMHMQDMLIANEWIDHTVNIIQKLFISLLSIFKTVDYSQIANTTNGS